MSGKRGANVSKCIRICTTWFWMFVVSVLIGVIVKRNFGWCWAVLSGIGFWVVAKFATEKYVIKPINELLLQDCFMPLPISIACSILFFPLSFINGGFFFSSVACILSGLLFTIGLLAYRCGRLENAWMLVPVAITFVYECIPLNMFGPVDDFIALGIPVLQFFNKSVLRISGPETKSLFCKQSELEDVG